jgi:hypothetical protein
MSLKINSDEFSEEGGLIQFLMERQCVFFDAENELLNTIYKNVRHQDTWQ